MTEASRCSIRDGTHPRSTIREGGGQDARELAPRWRANGSSTFHIIDESPSGIELGFDDKHLDFAVLWTSHMLQPVNLRPDTG